MPKSNSASKGASRETKVTDEHMSQSLEDQAGPANTSMEPRKAQLSVDEAFEAFYLRQASKEFADDLEKLRAANDFKGERSVQVLVEALKQGRACFAPGDRERIGRAARQI